jgi:hypothetical protein
MIPQRCTAWALRCSKRNGPCDNRHLDDSEVVRIDELWHAKASYAGAGRDRQFVTVNAGCVKDPPVYGSPCGIAEDEEW